MKDTGKERAVLNHRSGHNTVQQAETGQDMLRYNRAKDCIYEISNTVMQKSDKWHKD